MLFFVEKTRWLKLLTFMQSVGDSLLPFFSVSVVFASNTIDFLHHRVYLISSSKPADILPCCRNTADIKGKLNSHKQNKSFSARNVVSLLYQPCIQQLHSSLIRALGDHGDTSNHKRIWSTAQRIVQEHRLCRAWPITAAKKSCPGCGWCMS